jgi:peptidoglycan/xylan/chitin deacetylase (PgdA/CDA1 family)
MNPPGKIKASRPAIQIPILMYHEVASRKDTSSRLAVHPASFAMQLKYLHEAGFTALTVSETVLALAGDTTLLPDAITFDDGFADFHGDALPLLHQYGFTATVFITTGWIDDAGPNAAGRRPGRMLCWNQIREAAASGIEIGAHSHSHPQLDQITLRNLREELRRSKVLLEDELGSEVPSLAYPFGYSNACAVANVIANSEKDRFALPRLTIRRSTRPVTFDIIVQGQRQAVTLLKDQSLTKGWALVRRTRAVLTNAVRPRERGL